MKMLKSFLQFPNSADNFGGIPAARRIHRSKTTFSSSHFLLPTLNLSASTEQKLPIFEDILQIFCPTLLQLNTCQMLRKRLIVKPNQKRFLFRLLRKKFTCQCSSDRRKIQSSFLTVFYLGLFGAAFTLRFSSSCRIVDTFQTKLTQFEIQFLGPKITEAAIITIFFLLPLALFLK